MPISKEHRSLACTLFDLLQLVFEADGWHVFVSRSKKSKKAGRVLPYEKKIIIYPQVHIGGDIGSSAVTFLHEQIHAHCGVQENESDEMEKREEALVEIMERLVFDALDDKRKAHLEYMLKGKA